MVEGEKVTIARHGKAVARLVPIERHARLPEQQPEIDRLIEHLREGVDLGPPVFWTRDELYERGE